MSPPPSSALDLPVKTPDTDLADIVATGGTPFDDVMVIGDLAAFPGNLDHNKLVLPPDVGGVTCSEADTALQPPRRRGCARRSSSFRRGGGRARRGPRPAAAPPETSPSRGSPTAILG